MFLYVGVCRPRNKLEQLMLASVGRAREWIWYAFRHGVKSLAVDLFQDGFVVVHLRNEDADSSSDDDEEPLVIIDELLPSPERLEAMHLALGGARLQLPTAMRFASLTDLSLERIEIARGGPNLSLPALCRRRTAHTCRSCARASFAFLLLMKRCSLTPMRSRSCGWRRST